MSLRYSREEIQKLLETKTIIEYLKRENSDDKINEIYQKITNLLKYKCNHELDSDLIDLGNDRHQHITYCVHCYSTF